MLLDHCVPRRFGRLLTGHEVKTTHEMGWSALSNGRLLAQACPRFDAFLTVDQNVQFQQNLATLALPVGIMVAANNRFESLAPYATAVLDWLSRPLTREVVRIESGGQLIHVAARPSQS